MPKWSDIRALQFLDIYEKYECLWNPRIDEYKNKVSRGAAFDAMLAELQIPDLTPNDIKLKIKSIRTTYKRELSAVLKAEANRIKGGPVYTPKLFWFSRADKFLRPVSTSRYSSLQPSQTPKNESYQRYASPEGVKYSTVERETLHKKFKQEALHEITIALHDSDIEQQSNADDEPKDAIMHEEHNVQHEEQEVEESESVSEQQTIPMIDTIREETITVTPYRSNESYEQTTTSTIQEVEPVSSIGRNSSHEDDEYKLFCKSVEAQIRSIPDAYSRSVAKFKIQQVLFEAETGHYRKTAYVTIPNTHP